MKMLFAIFMFLMICLISCTKQRSELIQEKENSVLVDRSVENSSLSLVSVTKQIIPNANGTMQLLVGINVYSPNNDLKTMMVEMPPAIDQVPNYFTYSQQGFKPNTMGFSEIPTSAFKATDSITVKYFNGPLDHYNSHFSKQPYKIERFALR